MTLVRKLDWQKVRAKWRREAERYATKRHRKCNGERCYIQCGEPCEWCQEVMQYMRCMEEHADVLLSKAKECPF